MESGDARYRLKLASGFLEEAKAILKHNLFRAVVNACQLSIENSVKAVISLYKPVPKIHQISEMVEDILDEIDFSENEEEKMKRLQKVAEIMGFETHIRTDYGDELQEITPWELYDKDEATKALKFAEEGFSIAEEIIKKRNMNERGSR